MLIVLTFTLLFVSSAVSKPRYADLDEDEQQLFRAAYETPSYDQDEYEEPEDMQPGKLDLLKDGLWAIKAKINELKAFNKALAANLLSTKLKVKELLISKIMLKKHHHDTVEHKKPMHNYQPQPYPTYEPQIPQYGAPQYGHPYEPQIPQNGAPQYGHPYEPQIPQNGAPQYGHLYEPQIPQNGAPQYGHPYEPQIPQHGAPQYAHDPYYGI